MRPELSGPELEYNLAGGLLRMTNLNEAEKFLEDVRTSGFRAVTVLPFRGVEGAVGRINLMGSGLTIAHIENSWNPPTSETFRGAILEGLMGQWRRMRGDKSQPPIIQDAPFLPRERGEKVLADLGKISGAKLVSYTLESKLDRGRWLLGVHPGLAMSINELVDWSAANGVRLVFDPSHLLPNEGEWDRQMTNLAGKTEVVDIHPFNDPLVKNIGEASKVGQPVKELLSGKGQLAELVQLAKSLNGIRYLRVEIPIPLLKQMPGSPLIWRGQAFLRDLYQAIKEV